MANWALIPTREPTGEYKEQVKQNADGFVEAKAQYSETSKEYVPVVDDKGRVGVAVS